jgi:hypothetical protein
VGVGMGQTNIYLRAVAEFVFFFFFFVVFFSLFWGVGRGEGWEGGFLWRDVRGREKREGWGGMWEIFFFLGLSYGGFFCFLFFVFFLVGRGGEEG